MAEGALMTLDRFVADKTGAEMGFLYQDLIETCLAEVQNRYKQEKEMKTQMELQTLISEPSSPSVRIEQRREKYKTRPPHSSVYSIAPTAEDQDPEAKETAETTAPLFKVRQDTFDVFATLFKSSPESRGSIRWTEFEAAMTDRLEIHYSAPVWICVQVHPLAGLEYQAIYYVPSTASVADRGLSSSGVCETAEETVWMA